MSSATIRPGLQVDKVQNWEAPRIAVASSGLGHVARGVEAWAKDLGAALHRGGYRVTLFQGSGAASEPWIQVLNCTRRQDERAEQLVRRYSRFGGWRFGYANGYDVEQTSFARLLWPIIRREYDILHVQDPWLAYLFERMHRLKLSRPRVILAHGTEEPPAFLRKFSHLQHLAPCYLDQWEQMRPRTQKAFAIGNFIDTNTFRPSDQSAARQAFALPADHLVVLSVAAIKTTHKRVDYLLREFSAFSQGHPQPSILVVAGAREAETDSVIKLGHELLGDKVRFIEGLDRRSMPSLYQAADLFALSSLHEMMPIAVLEALASGLPIVCNQTPTLQWMVGPRNPLPNLAEEGAMCKQLHFLADPGRRHQAAIASRQHAEQTFAEPVVTRQILDMYEAVIGRS